MNQETLEKMRQTRLQGMYNAFKTSMESFKTESMTTDQFVAWLVSNEWDDRCNRMIERLIKQASFRYKASLARAQPARKARGIIFRQRIQGPVHHR